MRKAKNDQNNYSGFDEFNSKSLTISLSCIFSFLYFVNLFQWRSLCKIEKKYSWVVYNKLKRKIKACEIIDLTR